MGKPERLQKILAQAGFGSRRGCEAFILEGRVMVDGVVVRHLGSKADPETQAISFDGQKVSGPGRTSRDLQQQAEKVYYALNKPRGVVCTNQDPAGRPLAVQLVPERRRIYCVGRLDVDTEGLLLLTNDGDLTNLLTHPRFEVPKAYIVKVDGEVSGAQVERLQRGVHLAEGRTQGAQVRVRKRGRTASVLEVTIAEGLNREVRRILSAVGLRCRRLRRIRIGPLRLGAMPVGASRRLDPEEVRALLAAAHRAEQRAAGAPTPDEAAPEVTASDEAAEERDLAEPARESAKPPFREKPWQRGKGKPWRERRPDARSGKGARSQGPPWQRQEKRPWRERRPDARSGEGARSQGPPWQRQEGRPGRERREEARSSGGARSQGPPWKREKKRPWREGRPDIRSGEGARSQGPPWQRQEKRPWRERRPDARSGQGAHSQGPPWQREKKRPWREGRPGPPTR